MPKPKALDIFIVAEQFRYAGKLVTLAPITDVPIFRLFPHMPTAAMVCSAFSLELYFKCLIRIGRKTYRGQHDLEKLFALIGRKNRSKIRELWRANSQTVRSDVESSYRDEGRAAPKIDFNFVLSASNDAFVKIRYLYEGIDPDKGWLGDSIVEAARHVILAKYPDWENARQTAPLPKTSFGSAFQVP